MATHHPGSTVERRATAEREQLIARIAEEYRQMAGLSLTQAQARRLFDVDADRFGRLLRELVGRGIVTVDAAGLLVRGHAAPAPSINGGTEQAGEHRAPWTDGSIAGTAPVERRDHASRAARVQRVVEVIAATAEGTSVTAVADELPLPAAERILKSLALRGLVKVTDGRWAPRECLRMGVSLRPITE
jgi:hypothetical protein